MNFKLTILVLAANIIYTTTVTIVLTEKLQTEISEREDVTSILRTDVDRQGRDFMPTKERCDAIIQWHEATYPRERKPHSALKSER